MTQFDIQYRNLAEKILTDGQEYLTHGIDSATGKQLHAKKLFHKGFELDLREEFPILTTKKMPKSATHPENGFLFQSELHWIYVMGSNVVQELRDLGNNVWNEWEKEDGTIGPAYGHQARKLQAPTIKRHPAPIYTFPDQPTWHPWSVDYRNVDQIKILIDGLKKDPLGRRHVVNLWNVADLPDMGLVPCAFLTIWDVSVDGYLNCHLVQRSGDYFLGVPFNVSQYAMLVHMVAHVTGLKAGTLAHDITNVHIYENHYSQVEKQIDRKPVDCKPQIWINPDVKNFDDFKPTDIRIDNYESHSGLKGSVAIV